ncbi:unnamed protein product [Owenia fusiformis]|uniref:Uncharacterized protein n=1 Tax=Owenia fusiformis TaxID=6347 RepID=A0A8J1UJX3_OWEFU|nr:unnamed protein product [Owenia fusiformis]
MAAEGASVVGNIATTNGTITTETIGGMGKNATMDYDYFDIGWRAQYILSQPDHSIGLVLSIVSILANIGSLLAVGHLRGGLTAHRRFLISLIVSDIFVGLVVLVTIINFITNPLPLPKFQGDVGARNAAECARWFIKGLHRSSHIISLLNLLAMTLDHYIAIVRPLRYPSIVNSKRTLISIIALWTISFILGFSEVFAGIGVKLEHITYCEFITYFSGYDSIFIVFAIAVLCFITMAFVYAVIYKIVRHHVSIEMADNRKAVVTTLLIIGTFAICFLPETIFQIVMLIIKRHDPNFVRMHHKLFITLLKVNNYLYLLMLLNCLCDAIIYAARMRDVRNGYSRMIERWCPCCMRLRGARGEEYNSYTNGSSSRKTQHSQYTVTEEIDMQTTRML